MKNISKFKYYIAKFVWYHLDDGPTTQGGSWFLNGEPYCNGNYGTKPKSEEGWEDIGINSDRPEDITNHWRAFVCAYKWGALRNPAYNVNYELLSNNSRIKKVEIISQGKKRWFNRCTLKYYKTTKKLRKYYDEFLGTQFIFWETEKGQKCFTFTKSTIIKVFGKNVGIELKAGWNPSKAGRIQATARFPILTYP